ncbi:Fur-regulated basic protein FbpA [Sutcliffiella sp. NPDC057660]|uniref:Fur-regulated basic protein FbpA n=1 Tax=Sutcliffiella sp. NPDC057660 TaxID=3346199 RepID=UPI0036C6BED3
MGEILKNAVENRRSELISKLLYFRVFKKEDQHLYELSLSDLEQEYKKYDHYMHPHDDMGSIQWVKSK